MSGLGSVFNRGLDGLNVSSQGLATASNNIANINTQGYAKQSVNIVAGPDESADPSIGGGAQVQSVNAIVDPFVEMQLVQTSNTFGTYDGRANTINQIESTWNDSQTNGLGPALNDFFNSFGDLANKPQDTAAREVVQQKGLFLTEKFNQLSKQFNQMRSDLSNEISTRLQTINQLSSQIATLNQQIASAGGITKATDLVAQRQDTLRQLSQEINVNSFNDSNGNMEVQAAGGSPLVNGYTAGKLTMTDDQSYGGNATINLTLAGSNTQIDVTSGITGGRLGGNLTDRNTTLNSQISSLDGLAYQLDTQFNAVHSTGYGLNGSTGNNFFSALGSASGASASIALDASVDPTTGDPKNIAAAQADPTSSSSGPSDGRMATTISQLQNSLTMSAGTKTFAQYYSGLVANIGVISSSVNTNLTNQTNLLKEVQVQRESVSGVNMDEEGADLIRYQRAFQASAKLISVADQMMNTLLQS